MVVEMISEILDPLESAPSQTQKEENKMEQKAMWIRCLSITELLLETTKKNLTDPGIAGLLSIVILPSVQHPSTDVRNAAVKCLGLFCLLSQEAAKKHMLLFLQIVKNDRENIKLTAIKILFDFLLVFGINPFQEQSFDDMMSQDISASQSINVGPRDEPSVVLNTLVQFLNSVHQDTRTATAEGFAKLLFADVVNDPKILSKLLVLFFNPATENDLRLRQCLSIFFVAFAASSKHKDLVEQACLPTVKSFLRAPKKASLAGTNLAQVVQFILYLMQDKSNKRTEFHEQLGISICASILQNPEGQMEVKLCKGLTMIELSKDMSQDVIKYLRMLTKDLTKKVTDKAALKFVEKFAANLLELDLTPNEPLPANKVNELAGKKLRVDEKLTEEAKKERFLKQQQSYFEEIDNFELDSGSQKEKKRKKKEKEDEETSKRKWEEEREKFIKDKEKMEEELKQLRQIINGGGKAPPVSDNDNDPKNKRRVSFSSKIEEKSIASSIPPSVNLKILRWDS